MDMYSMLADWKHRLQVDALWNKFCTKDLPIQYEPPLDMFGADKVEKWFTEKQVDEIVSFLGSG
jgi:hypothetical protein